MDSAKTSYVEGSMFSIEILAVHVDLLICMNKGGEVSKSQLEDNDSLITETCLHHLSYELIIVVFQGIFRRPEKLIAVLLKHLDIMHVRRSQFWRVPAQSHKVILVQVLRAVRVCSTVD